MRNFFKSLKFKIILSVLTVLLLGVFIAAVSTGGSTPLSNALNFVMRPLNTAARQLSDALSDFRAGFVSSAYYHTEIESLQAEIESYKEELVDHEKLEQKLASYEQFLDVKSTHPDYHFQPATVIMRDPTDIYATFTIDRGTADGVKPDMPVIFGANLVGVVREVTGHSAVVYTLYHPDVSVSAYEIRTREDCYTEAENGASLAGQIKLMGLSRTSPVAAGGIVCTSGIGGIYPRDLVIGTVSQVVSSEEDNSAFGLVDPSVDLKSLVDVFVITNYGENAG